MEFAADGARIFYETWGAPSELPSVTLVNGHTRTTRDFRAMGNYLSARGWHVLSLDNRGSGATVTLRPFSMEDLVGDVPALWKHLGVRRSHLLGISLGGMIAMRLAARRPPELESLVLVSTAANWNEPLDDFGSTEPGELERKLLRYFSPDFASRQRLLIESMIRELAKAFREPARRAATEEQRRTFQGFDAASELGHIAVPTLVLHGEEDRVMPVDRARALAVAIPGATLETFAGVGHLLLAEAAPRFYDAADRFWRNLCPRPSTKAPSTRD